MRSMAKILFLVLTFAGTSSALAQNTAAPCSAAEHRQFDFWLGEWEVTANGKAAGTNSIHSILGGCVLMEEWQSSGGQFSGKSFNRYDPDSKKWEQIWVDSSGGILKLTGEYKNGQMILQGAQGTGEEAVIDRITWTNNDDGTVRQLWEKSKDGGVSWTTAFDGLYRKVEAAD